MKAEVKSAAKDVLARIWLRRSKDAYFILQDRGDAGTDIMCLGKSPDEPLIIAPFKADILEAIFDERTAYYLMVEYQKFRHRAGLPYMQLKVVPARICHLKK
jgi:hypothetical protein